MTAKRCSNCKHEKGIGFDFWCGEGHTEYEVFGGTTDCPYYEYHDWSKGIPDRTTKRFVLFKDGETIIDNESVADDGGKNLYWTVEYVQIEKLVELLNELHEENNILKQELKTKAVVNRQYEELQTFKKENKQLKKRLAEREKMLDVRDKIIGDVSKALNGDLND